MLYTKSLDEIFKKDVPVAGGKGAFLGEMIQANFNVPAGFVVLAQAFEHFLFSTKIYGNIETILNKINYRDLYSVNKASKEISIRLHNKQIPKHLQEQILLEYKKLNCKLVAVRSSATAEDSKTASWAGELETYLNVTKKNLIKSVIKCWSSLFTPRAIFYRFEKKLHKQKVSVAVVIQKMVQSEISGICFTVHPVTKDYNQMVIEAGFGLGEAIVGGQITPDTYIINKNNFSIQDISVSEQKMAIVRSDKGNLEKKLLTKRGNKQKLSEKQMVELARICKSIEKHYKHPQDIEWANKKGKFYIIQSRPITTL